MRIDNYFEIEGNFIFFYSTVLICYGFILLPRYTYLDQFNLNNNRLRNDNKSETLKLIFQSRRTTHVQI
jgi:hypothetical protein